MGLGRGVAEMLECLGPWHGHRKLRTLALVRVRATLYPFPRKSALGADLREELWRIPESNR